VNLLSYGIIVNNTFLREKPEVVRRFLAATLKAYDYTFKNMDEAIDIFVKRTADTSPKAQHKAELLVYQQNLHTENTRGKPLGWQADKDWDRMLSTLEKYGGMTSRRPASEYFTNEYLPAN